MKLLSCWIKSMSAKRNEIQTTETKAPPAEYDVLLCTLSGIASKCITYRWLSFISPQTTVHIQTGIYIGTRIHLKHRKSHELLFLCRTKCRIRTKICNAFWQLSHSMMALRKRTLLELMACYFCCSTQADVTQNVTAVAQLCCITAILRMVKPLETQSFGFVEDFVVS